MNIPTKTGLHKIPHRGFSLIEVLIAVVVLSVGLLALAALQGNLVRSSSATRTQSQALALGQDTLEELRGFTTTAGYTSIAASSGSTAATYPCSGTAWTTCTIGANTFTRTVTVDRFKFGGGTSCQIPDPVPNSFVQLTGSCATSDPVGTNEFKRVSVDVSWTNEAAQTTTASVSDVISVAAPGDSLSALAAQNATRNGPKVYLDKSRFAPGVIPIAIGNNQAAAASDPQPETFSTGHITTRFSVQTYIDSSTSNEVLLTKQVDFGGTSCTCQVGTASTSTSPAYAPTYWNGTKYVVPAPVIGKATGVDPVSTGNANNSSQDPVLCQSCCRDHHDGTAQVDVNGNPLLYDAFRPGTPSNTNFGEYTTGGDHKHYDTDSSNNLQTSVVSTAGAEYFETCRFVRVDGINRVATDARLENHIVIAPNSPITITIPAGVSCDPSGDNITTGICYDHQVDSTTAALYSTFVKDYVAGSKNTSGITGFYDAWVSTTAASTYPVINGSNGVYTPAIGNLLNNPVTGEQVSLVDGTQSSSPTATSTLAAKTAYAALLNPPAQTIPAIQTNDQLYLEGRGIYIDYISPEAKAAINCVGQTTNTDCIAYANLNVLQVIPFFAVNLTNLDAWVDNDVVGSRSYGNTPPSNEPIPSGGTYDPAIIGYQFDRGSVYAVLATPVQGQNKFPDYVYGQARRGNAGLIDSLSVSPSYPHEAYFCMATFSGNTPPDPTGVCSADPPAANQNYATIANATASNGNTVAANGVNFRQDTQPYTVTGTTSYPTFKVSITDNSVTGNAKSNMGSPVAIAVAQPVIPRTLATCKVGKGNKKPFTCYDSDNSATYSPIRLNFANYNTQVSCNGQSCPQTPAINDYKICSVTITTGTGTTAVVSSPTNGSALNEQTSVTLTLPSTATLNTTAKIDTYLSTLAVTANFYAESQTCP